MEGYKLVAVVLLLVFGLTLGISTSLPAAGLIEQALKVFGISYVVRKFGGQINDFITKLSGERGVKWEGTTKVVPIISVGQGGYIGAAQVQGPTDRVSTVRAVGQVETSFQNFRAKLLVPVNTTSLPKNPTRVKGVGVSALVDFKI